MSTVEAKHARPAARIVRLLGDVDFADQGTFCARLDAAVSLGAPIIVDMDRFRVISSIRPRCRHGTVVPDSQFWIVRVVTPSSSASSRCVSPHSRRAWVILEPICVFASPLRFDL